MGGLPQDLRGLQGLPKSRKEKTRSDDSAGFVSFACKKYLTYDLDTFRNRVIQIAM
jgi:hypothetical protein